MIVAYARIGSFRAVADTYRVNFKTLQRHINHCVYSVMEEEEEKRFRVLFEYVSSLLEIEFMQPPKKRPVSIITKKIEYTWSRRSWRKNEEKLDKSIE